ncbi:NAD(P)-dependent oxidoreductase (plasmid) [Erwinia pyri]|uniref:NAD(P)-dependent oxidoreductase n=1 Tax=Erwinia pyri TaxID=3062598 RepID=A0AA50DN92_9GAMM|nr:NAD(P)-dependent oxidoreductase [Erwinia sp. DE2]WLS81069.1 NAD(P)-dependent oxidoreductase [Erwinia sp. DE2]
MHIGIIGTGAMGREIARNLVADGHLVCAWNRSGGEIEGVRRADSPEQALQAEVTFTMLSDDSSIRQVLIETEILSHARPGLVHIIGSTISVAFSQTLVELHEAAGIALVAAPVLGRPAVAAKRALNILAAGDPAAMEKVRPVLEAIGKRIWHMGDKPPMAHAAKIACNMMITMAIEAMAEAVVLTEASGVERERFFDLILNTLFGSRTYQVYSANIINELYEPGFKATLGLKDLRLAKEAAAVAGRTLPLLQAVHRQMHNAVSAGSGDRDWSVMANYTIRTAT